jgi:hypothetical protein
MPEYVAPTRYGQCKHGNNLASCDACEREKPEYREAMDWLKRHIVVSLAKPASEVDAQEEEQ